MKLYQFVKNQGGVTNIEYALIASGIAMAIVLIVGSIGSGLEVLFASVESGLRTGG